MPWNKVKTNYVVDLMMATSFIVTGLTGLILFFFLPSGVQRGGQREFLGLIKATWTDIHNYAGLVMIAAVLIHLILHWSWIVCMTKSFFSKKKDISEQSC